MWVQVRAMLVGAGQNTLGLVNGGYKCPKATEARVLDERDRAGLEYLERRRRELRPEVAWGRRRLAAT